MKKAFPVGKGFFLSEGGNRMIRDFQRKDLEPVMEIWLSSNLQAHAFVAPSYWMRCAPEVREMIPQAEVLVEEKNGEIQGFAGMIEDHLAGIFVREERRSQGVGKQLLDAVKKRHSKITLQTYQKNSRAVEFYQREGFSVCGERIEPDSGEMEFQMVWGR